MKETNKILVTFKSELLDLSFEIIKLDAFYKREDKNRRIPHVLNFYAVLFITEGEGKHEIDFETYAYNKNSVLFINKGQEHRWVEYENTNGYILLFTEKFLENNQLKFKDLSYTFPYNTLLYEPLMNLSKTETKSFRTLVAHLYEEYKLSYHSDKDEILQCLLRAFLLKIKGKKDVEKKRISPDQEELFITFQKLIDTRINQSRNVKDYCKWLSVSYKKLNDTCKSLTGKTAKSFLDETLVLKAKQLLVESRLSISEISYVLSFEEPTNFTKFFKKHTGLSPKKFQKTNLSTS